MDDRERFERQIAKSFLVPLRFIRAPRWRWWHRFIPKRYRGVPPAQVAELRQRWETTFRGPTSDFGSPE